MLGSEFHICLNYRNLNFFHFQFIIYTCTTNHLVNHQAVVQSSVSINVQWLCHNNVVISARHAGLAWVFQKLLISWDFHAWQSLEFPQKRVHPVHVQMRGTRLSQRDTLYTHGETSCNAQHVEPWARWPTTEDSKDIKDQESEVHVLQVKR